MRIFDCGLFSLVPKRELGNEGMATDDGLSEFGYNTCQEVIFPLEKTYMAAWDAVPRRWQEVIAPS